MSASDPHSYEEIRDVVVDILLGKETTRYAAEQFQSLKEGVHEVLERRHPNLKPRRADVEELVRDVFWDLFRQGVITLGFNRHNDQWPFFRLSHFGQQTLVSQSPWRFHDSTSYLAMVRREAPDLSDEAFAYLDEAVQTFYAQCLLASSVMLGVAAETEFLRLLAIAESHPTIGHRFQSAAKAKFVAEKISKFVPILTELRPKLNKEAMEGLETNFLAVQLVLRIARNEAGHPSSANPQRENVYVNLQLFVPFARQMMRLRQALIAFDPG
jgi:hypothetical protein